MSKQDLPLIPPRVWLERRAAALGIAKVAADRGTLLRDVLSAEYPHFEVLGQPHYEPIPGCYAVQWSAVEADSCRSCRVQTLCLHRFAHATVPNAASELSEPAASVIARSLRTEASAVVFARAFKRWLSEGSSASLRHTPHPGRFKKGAPARKLHSAFGATLLASMRRKRDASAPKISVQSVTGAVAPSSGPPTPLHPGGPPPKKPRQYDAVNRAHPKTGKQPYGEHTFQSRFAREKKRSPKLALLPVGTVMKRLYKRPDTGEVMDVTVKVMEDHYLYANKRWPTLYDIAKAVTGSVPNTSSKRHKNPRQISNYSGTKFFRRPLKALLESARI